MKKYLLLSLFLGSFLTDSSCASFRNDEEIQDLLNRTPEHFHDRLLSNIPEDSDKDTALLLLNLGIEDLIDSGLDIYNTGTSRNDFNNLFTNAGIFPHFHDRFYDALKQTPQEKVKDALAFLIKGYEVQNFKVRAESPDAHRLIDQDEIDLMTSDELTDLFEREGILSNFHGRLQEALKQTPKSDVPDFLNSFLASLEADGNAVRGVSSSSFSPDPDIDDFRTISPLPSAELFKNPKEWVGILNKGGLTDGMDIHKFNRVIAQSVRNLIAFDQENGITIRDVSYDGILNNLIAINDIPNLGAAINQLRAHILGGDREGEIALSLSELLERSYNLALYIEAAGHMFREIGENPMTPTSYLAHKIAENVTGGGGCIQGHAGRLADVYMQFFRAFIDVKERDETINALYD